MKIPRYYSGLSFYGFTFIMFIGLEFSFYELFCDMLEKTLKEQSLMEFLVTKDPAVESAYRKLRQKLRLDPLEPTET